MCTVLCDALQILSLLFTLQTLRPEGLEFIQILP